jgi:hypothetical protein
MLAVAAATAFAAKGGRAIATQVLTVTTMDAVTSPATVATSAAAARLAARGTTPLPIKITALTEVRAFAEEISSFGHPFTFSTSRYWTLAMEPYFGVESQK